jgi:hypothetical protein
VQVDIDAVANPAHAMDRAEHLCFRIALARLKAAPTIVWLITAVGPPPWAITNVFGMDIPLLLALVLA